MPYLRLYSREVSLAEKRLLAEKLIRITLGAFQLRPEQRANITIQFVARELAPANSDLAFSADEPAAVLEVSHCDLTVHNVRALVEAAAPLLSQSAVVPRPGRIAKILGTEPDPARQIGFQFKELRSPGEDAEDLAYRQSRKAA
jgi:hypothetical protein